MPLFPTPPRRFWIGGLMLGVGAILAVGFTPLPIGGRFAAKYLNMQIFERTGLTATAATSDFRLSFFPFPKYSVANLLVSAPDGAALARIAKADAYLRPLDLVGGRLAFTGFFLSKPTFDASTGDARAAWRKAGGRLAESAARAPSHPLADVALAEGVVLTGPEPATDIVATIAWAGGDAPLSIWARGRWKGETAELRVADLRPEALLDGQSETPARISATTPFGSLEARGVAASGAAPRFDGDVRLDVLSADRLARWLRIAVPLEGVIDRYSIEGRASVSPRGFSSSSVAVKAAGGRLEGTMALRLDTERPQISGTLASQSLDFDSLTPAVDAVRARSGAWSEDAFDPAPLRRTDVDLRLSAASVRLLGARLSDAAISIMLAAGKLEFVLGRAQAYDGAIRGRATLQALDDARVEARLQGTFENIDVGAATQELFGRRALTGRGQGQAQLEATGASPAEIARQSSGKLSVQIKDGEISGVNVLDAARRLDRVANGAIALGPGRTPFDQLTLTANIAQGVAIIQDASLASAGLTIKATGAARIEDQSLQIEGRAQAAGLPTAGLPFLLRGPMGQPDLRWDLTAAFRRS